MRYDVRPSRSLRDSPSRDMVVYHSTLEAFILQVFLPSDNVRIEHELRR